MPVPELHIVGGFLGSGKTTAIAAAARRYMARGKKVGVITNDQGRYLVDTLFFENRQVPTVEVTGGCFCCNYDDFEERLKALDAAARPDVIFAESVGSCADVVATVVRPLLDLGNSGFTPTSFSVFADCRLLRLRMDGAALPFADEVVYIFDKQLEEAGLIVINKVDLLETNEAERLAKQMKTAYPGRAVVLQNSLEKDGVDEWLELIGSTDPAGFSPLADIDYAIYGAGEAALAWVDGEIGLSLRREDGRMISWEILSGIERAVRARGWAVGHMKFIVETAEERHKVSFTTVSDRSDENPLPELADEDVRLLINARVAAPKDDLEDLITQVIHDVIDAADVTLRTGPMSSFHPSFPRPTHRSA